MQACVVFVDHVSIGDHLRVWTRSLSWLADIEVNAFILASFGRVLTALLSERFEIIDILRKLNKAGGHCVGIVYLLYTRLWVERTSNGIIGEH